jgi:predicted dehydrogenase
MARVRIAVVGAGVIGLRHIEEIKKSSTARLSGVVDHSPSAHAIAAAETVPLYSSLDELLSIDRPDGVIIATPNQLHLEQGLQCINAGVPALIEKPLAHTLDAGKLLVEAAETSNAKLLVGHHRPHSPILQKAVEVIQSGELGRIVAVMGSAAFYKPDADGYYEGPNAWRRQPGGGPILINMTHEVGNLRAMLGEIVTVQALSSNATRGFEVEDTVAINLRFANGALGTFLLSDTTASPKSWEQTSRENAAYDACGDEDAYVIMGTNGSLGIPTMRLRCYAKPEDRSWFKPLHTEVLGLERADPLTRQIEHFAAVIAGEAKPLVGARDGWQNLRVTDAILQAAKSGIAISISKEGGLP